ncbi:MAG: hypothetical protein WDW36_009527 [Sanguina aurantia]
MAEHLQSCLTSSSSPEKGSALLSKDQPQIPAQQQQEDDSLSTKLAQSFGAIVASPLFYFVAGAVAIKLVASTGESSASILIFAALPVTALTALSKSSIGKSVQLALEAQLPKLSKEAAELRASWGQARTRSANYGEERPLLPGVLGSAGREGHLRGAVAGDVGFDPMGMSADPAAFAKNYEAELLHARWAMLGAVGCLIPEALTLFGGVELGEPVWWKVGASKVSGDLTLNWGGIEGFRIAGKQGIAVIAGCQLALMGGPEYARLVGIDSLQPVGVFLPGDQNYPGGGPFDPLGLSQDPDRFVTQAVSEIKNGRLAMVAMLGYIVQAAVTGKGPVQNLLDFSADPANNNLVSSLQHLPDGFSRVRAALPF